MDTYQTGRRMKIGGYRFNEREGRFEFFLKYWTCPETGKEYKIFANRGEMENLLGELESYGRVALSTRVIARLLPEGVRRQIASSFK